MSFDYVFDYGTNIHIISLEQTLSSLKVIITTDKLTTA
jgi:ribosomal protein S2